MFGDILKIVAREINSYMDKNSMLPSGTKIVVADRPYGSDNSVNIPDNTISLSLLNIEEEVDIRTSTTQKRVVDGKVYIQQPDIYINLQVIFIANFKNDYISELNYITKIIEFFQKNPFFTSDMIEGLKSLELDKITFKLNTVSLKDQHTIWSLLGGKYMPSVVYTIGMIVIQDKEKFLDTKIVKKVNIETKELHKDE